MKLRTDLPLAAANRIVERALEAGRAAGMKPLTVAVLDAGGHPVALQREDGAGILRPEIATGKAWGALGMGESSRALARPPGRAGGVPGSARGGLRRPLRRGAGRRPDPGCRRRR